MRVCSPAVWFERLVFIAGGMLMFIPGTLTDLIGIAIAVVLLALNLKKVGARPQVHHAAPEEVR